LKGLLTSFFIVLIVTSSAALLQIGRTSPTSELSQTRASSPVSLTKPDFTIQVTPASLTIGHTPGSGVPITITSVDNYSGTVALSSTRPGGLATGPGPTSVVVPANGTAGSILYFDTYFVPPGDYVVNITGTDGSLVHSTTLRITLIGPDFRISAPPSVAVFPGAFGVNVAQILVTSIDNFTGPVQLSGYVGNAFWLHASFNPGTVVLTPNVTASSELTIDSSSRSAMEGSYNLTIYGYNQGTVFSFTKTVSVDLTVDQSYLYYKLDYLRPTPGSRTLLINSFTNRGQLPVSVLSGTVSTDFGEYPIPGLPLMLYGGQAFLSDGQTLERNMTIIIPLNARIGNHTVTVTVSWKYYSPDLSQSYEGNALVATGTIQIYQASGITKTIQDISNMIASLTNGSVSLFALWVLVPYSFLATLATGLVIRSDRKKQRSLIRN
jgi:hypothetical protein